jgi:hypothetical protein
MGLEWNTPGPRPIIASAGEAVPNRGAAAKEVLAPGRQHEIMPQCVVSLRAGVEAFDRQSEITSPARVCSGRTKVYRYL